MDSMLYGSGRMATMVFKILEIGMLPGLDRLSRCQFQYMATYEIMAVAAAMKCAGRLGAMLNFFTYNGVVDDNEEHWQIANASIQIWRVQLWSNATNMISSL